MLDMRFRPFQVARLFGIPVMIDYSWVPMALLHVWLLAQFWLPMQVNPPLPMWQNLVMGLVITTLFFGSVLGHELAHALVARLEGIKIHDIQLHIFGGWARLVGEPKTAMAEFRVAVAGPVASFLLAIFFWLCLFTVQEFSNGVLIDRALAAGFFIWRRRICCWRCSTCFPVCRWTAAARCGRICGTNAETFFPPREP